MMPITAETKRAVILKFCQTRDGWQKIANSMIQPIRVAFGFYMREARHGFRSTPPSTLPTKQFTAQPSPYGLDKAHDAINQWMQTESERFAAVPHLLGIRVDELLPAAIEGEPCGAKLTAKITWKTETVMVGEAKEVQP